ncbi:MAG: beta-RFAP synthase [Planctomycetes bacterium]|nr:beta-RFAP synthase [Planctomycetota bacterium]
MSQPTTVTITTGCRLHFGLLAPRPSEGPRFGGLGAMLDAPGWQVRARRASAWAVEASPEVRPTVDRLVEWLRREMPILLPPADVAVVREVDRHAGLGSGTQLSLAVARALSTLAGQSQVSAAELALFSGRGLRSAVGVHGFEVGGLIVDGGKRPGEPLGTLQARCTLPDEWRFVLVAPPAGSGVSGDSEADAFSRLPPTPEPLIESLSQLIQSTLLPAAASGDFRTFSAALYRYGELVGGYFAPLQGGQTAHPQAMPLIEALRARGIAGIGQSSWGPTVFALLPRQSEADELVAGMARNPRWKACRFHIAAPLNRGAEVVCEG